MTDHQARPPSGDQHIIAFEDQTATIVEVGGGVRTYSHGDRDVLHPYDLDAVCDGAHGAPLIPWPNRLADGRYSFDGEDFQVPLTEPEQGNAIHGFLRWRPWRGEQRDDNCVVMTTSIHPMKGYPFDVEVSVEYTLGTDGLRVATTATNRGDRPCPYGAGQHPYLSPGSGTLDACQMQVTADTRVDTGERQLPSGLVAVEGTEYDLREPRPLGSLALDYAFTDLLRDADGRAWIRLTGPDGRTAGLWVDESYHLLQVYSADTLAGDRRRAGLGAEPMTLPPNGFATGERVIRLEPGESVTTTWGAVLS